MTKLPPIFGFLQRIILVFVFIAAIIFPISEFIAGGLFKLVLSIPILGAFVLKSVGETLSMTQSVIITVILLALIYVVLYNLESRSRFWPKRIAHTRGVRVSAKILNTKIIVYEGTKGARTPVVRFDFEIEHEGKLPKPAPLNTDFRISSMLRNIRPA